jgi:GLPGLI family protein
MGIQSPAESACGSNTPKITVMLRYTFLVLFISCSQVLRAQSLFIDKANIEFEMTVNNYKSYDAWFENEDGQETSWQERFKDQASRYTISYYDFSFSGNKSVYTFNRLDEKNRSRWDNDAAFEGNTWYHDYNSGNSAFKRYFWGSEFVFTDSIKEMKWKMVPNENRVIAGFNCRKAYTVLFDSVYVFAFYTDEIVIPGGPVGLHGLPGMILGVTVPRMFASWIATRVTLTGVDENRIVSPAGKKPKTRKEILDKFLQRAEEDGKWIQRNIWSLFL